MSRKLLHKFENIISLDNLLSAWREFFRGKKNRSDVQKFNLNLMDNLIDLHRELSSQSYCHGTYQHFRLNDPKPRDIHKASVRDRVVHRSIYRVLYLFFNQVFITDSFSCRLFKGTHKATDRFRSFAYQVSKNNTKTTWVLKCDIKKFFASIDQALLLEIISQRVFDPDLIWLISQIINSFHSTRDSVGLPLGNLTSQLLVNVYMNEFDQWLKQTMKVKYYIRYADDFVILHNDQSYLEELLWRMDEFLTKRLKLSLHPDKVYIKSITSGVDFLGWVHFSDHRVLRTATKKKMFRNLQLNKDKPAVVQSYLGLLGHGNTQKLRTQIEDLFF